MAGGLCHLPLVTPLYNLYQTLSNAYKCSHKHIHKHIYNHSHTQAHVQEIFCGPPGPCPVVWALT